MIPSFDKDGNLQPGVHACTLVELRTRLGSNPRRLALVDGVERVARMLKLAGCTRLYLDGSFVTSKEAPGDFDGCWSIAGVDDSLLDPVLLDFSFERFFQKLKYGGELFPADWIEAKTGITWLEFFQQDKDTGAPKGILEIRLDQEAI